MWDLASSCGRTRFELVAAMGALEQGGFTFLFLFPKQLGQTPIAVNFWVDERRYGDLNCG